MDCGILATAVLERILHHWLPLQLPSLLSLRLYLTVQPTVKKWISGATAQMRNFILWDQVVQIIVRLSVQLILQLVIIVVGIVMIAELSI